MIDDSHIPPVPHIPFDELLIECVDALRHQSYDGQHRSEHIRHLEVAAIDQGQPIEVRDLLNAVAQHFLEQIRFNHLWHMANDDAESVNLAKALENALGDEAARYVYHGTICGNLAGIAKEGLIAGKRPVWSEKLVPRTHCNSGVFFAQSWRGAMNWADIAHYSSRGPRNGRHRTPCVLRIPKLGLALEPDCYRQDGCSQVVRGVVRATTADVLVGRVQGFPQWRPLAEVLATK